MSQVWATLTTEDDRMQANVNRTSDGVTHGHQCTVTGHLWLDCLVFVLLGLVLLVGSRRLVVYDVVPSNMRESVAPEDRESAFSTDWVHPDDGS